MKARKARKAKRFFQTSVSRMASVTSQRYLLVALLSLCLLISFYNTAFSAKPLLKGAEILKPFDVEIRPPGKLENVEILPRGNGTNFKNPVLIANRNPAGALIFRGGRRGARLLGGGGIQDMVIVSSGFSLAGAGAAPVLAPSRIPKWLDSIEVQPGETVEVVIDTLCANALLSPPSQEDIYNVMAEPNPQSDLFRLLTTVHEIETVEIPRIAKKIVRIEDGIISFFPLDKPEDEDILVYTEWEKRDGEFIGQLPRLSTVQFAIWVITDDYTCFEFQKFYKEHEPNLNRRELKEISELVAPSVTLLLERSKIDKKFVPVLFVQNTEIDDLVEGQVFTVDVCIEDVRGLARVTVDTIQFDPSSIEVVEVTEGEFLRKDGDTNWKEPNIDNKMGKISGLSVEQIGKKGSNGSGVIATIHFNVKQFGNYSFTLEEVTVWNNLDFEMTPQIESGSVKVPNPQGTLDMRIQLLTTWGAVKNQLFQNYPNPFNPDTWIPYQLAQGAPVTIQIYTVKGQLVRELSLGRQAAGVYLEKDRAAYWDGRNQEGQPVASGLYFYRLRAGDFVATRRMFLQK